MLLTTYGTLEIQCRGVDDQFINEFMCNNGMNAGENDEDVGYRRLVEQAEQELHPGSSFSKLSFILHLFHLKSMYGWSVKSFDMLLQLIVTVFPQVNRFPSSWS